MSLLICLGFALPATAHAWWQDDWHYRKQISVDTTPQGAAINDPLPEQEDEYSLASVGLGTRASLSKWLSGSLDWGYPLLDGPNTQKQDARLHFSVQATF